METTAAKKY
jgi:hypothetical protein